MSFKSALKEILPAPVIAYAAAVKQQINLAAIAPAEFLPDSLKPSSDFLVPRVLGDADAALTWEVDSKEIEKFHPPQDLYGGVNPGDRRALYTLVRALKPASVLEVGTHIGSSTVHIAKALKTNLAGHLTTVDVYDVNDPENGSWKKYNLPLSVKATLEQADVADRVTFRTDGAQAFLQKTDLNFDLIFLDGDHSAAAVYSEVSAALKRLSPDGIIVLHDYFPDGKALFPGEPVIHGPYLGMRRVMSEHKEVHVIPLGELPWPTKLGGNTTSLAVVVKHAVG